MADEMAWDITRHALQLSFTRSARTNSTLGVMIVSLEPNRCKSCQTYRRVSRSFNSTPPALMPQNLTKFWSYLAALRRSKAQIRLSEPPASLMRPSEKEKEKCHTNTKSKVLPVGCEGSIDQRDRGIMREVWKACLSYHMRKREAGWSKRAGSELGGTRW